MNSESPGTKTWGHVQNPGDIPVVQERGFHLNKSGNRG